MGQEEKIREECFDDGVVHVLKAMHVCHQQKR